LNASQADIARMRDELLFDGPEAGRKLSRFWILLALAALIASAGIVADSTATVIGAMIVAPLMTPILGTVFSAITGDGVNLARSLSLVVAGAALVVAVGWLCALLVPVDVVASTSSQVAGRVQPRLIDLVAALATGAVGAFALVRSDVSDTLPGVAIAISLVPPLAVVGTTLEAGATGESGGALLLFLTNVGAILLSGFVVMGLYRTYRAWPGSTGRVGRSGAVVTVVVFVVLLGLELSVTSARVATDSIERADVAAVAETWAESDGWLVDSVETTPDGVEVEATGPLPGPDPEELRRELDAAGLSSVDVVLELSPSQRVELDAG
jgi:uncharacterized hydrophobic protein (TIGR00271 family)